MHIKKDKNKCWKNIFLLFIASPTNEDFSYWFPFSLLSSKFIWMCLWFPTKKNWVNNNNNDIKEYTLNSRYLRTTKILSADKQPRIPHKPHSIFLQRQHFRFGRNIIFQLQPRWTLSCGALVLDWKSAVV